MGRPTHFEILVEDPEEARQYYPRVFACWPVKGRRIDFGGISVPLVVDRPDGGALDHGWG